MYFDSFGDFLAMGNHGIYVWLSYGAFLLVLAWIGFDLVISRRTNMTNARKTWKREPMKREVE